jgi:purine-binding chemotaxis protein CheW
MSAGGIEEILVFRVADELFGFEVERACEVLRAPPITPVPFTPEAVRGVAAVRSDLLPVLDAARHLLGRDSAGASHLLVFQSRGGERLALLTGAVTELVPLPAGGPAPMPDEADASLPEGAARGVFHAASGATVTLLDPDTLAAAVGHHPPRPDPETLSVEEIE